MTDTPEQDVRELAAKLIADQFCDEAYYVSWERLPERNRDYYRAFADEFLAAVTPVIRRQERAKLTPPLDSFEADLLFEQSGAFAAFLSAREARIRRQVAEEIAEDITETVGGYPGNEARRPHMDRGELLNDANWAAAIARSHSTREEQDHA